jgi:hypothetical protein
MHEIPVSDGPNIYLNYQYQNNMTVVHLPLEESTNAMFIYQLKPRAFTVCFQYSLVLIPVLAFTTYFQYLHATVAYSITIQSWECEGFISSEESPNESRAYAYTPIPQASRKPAESEIDAPPTGQHHDRGASSCWSKHSCWGLEAGREERIGQKGLRGCIFRSGAA